MVSKRALARLVCSLFRFFFCIPAIPALLFAFRSFDSMPRAFFLESLRHSQRATSYTSVSPLSCSASCKHSSVSVGMPGRRSFESLPWAFFLESLTHSQRAVSYTLLSPLNCSASCKHRSVSVGLPFLLVLLVLFIDFGWFCFFLGWVFGRDSFLLLISCMSSFME